MFFQRNLIPCFRQFDVQSFERTKSESYFFRETVPVRGRGWFFSTKKLLQEGIQQHVSYVSIMINQFSS